MDELAAMRIFAKVVETGGSAGAGRALGLAPPSVTRRVDEFEAMLGVALLLRSTRKPTLTEAGECYKERIRDIVGAVEEAKHCVSTDGAEPADGRLVERLTDVAPEPARTPVSAVYAPGPYKPAKVRVFIDFLAARFADRHDWATAP